MTYRIKGIAPDPFRKYFGLSEAELAAQGVIRKTVDEYPGYPDRITMQDMQIGDVALLLNYEHLAVDTPYRSRHAIYVKDGADQVYDAIGTVPDVMKRRILALRGIDQQGCIIEADLAEGDGIEASILRLFENPAIHYIHAHYAQRGCFSGVIERA